MNGQILQSVEDVWEHHRSAIEVALTEAIDELKELLNADEYHQHAHDPAELKRSLGPLGAANLDLGSLSRVLDDSSSSRALPPKRLKRVQELIPALGRAKEAFSKELAGSASIDIDSDESEILQRAEQHFNWAAEVIRTLRVAQLEIGSKYEAQTHDALFADFRWDALGPGELRLCPPFLVKANLDGDGAAAIRKMTSLLESGMPIKIVALRSGVRQDYPPGSDPRLPATLTVETLPLAMRGVYFVQTCAADPESQQRLFEGLTAPRPGVISVLSPRDREDQAAFEARADRAVRARAFPICVYDPDRTDGFVTCFDLSANPSPESLWTVETLSGRDEQGQPLEVDEVLTFAHFAASEPEFANDVSDPPAVEDSLVPMAEYLEFSRRQQAGKLPFVVLSRQDGTIVRKVVSPAIAQQCSERCHLWRTLQEVSGVDNPFVNTTRTALQKELGAQQQELLKSQQQKLEQDAANRAQAAVAAAVRNLVANLTGVDPSKS